MMTAVQDPGVHPMDDWQRIAEEYGPLVWKTAYRLLAHQADAADCFQETFLSALDVARRQRVEHWAGLLQRLATARALDALRRRIREAGRRGSLANWEGLPADQADPTKPVQNAELVDQLRQVLAQIPDQQAEVFCLRHLNELSYEEIAASTGLSVDAVGVTLHRAKARLRELLMSTYGNECNRR